MNDNDLIRREDALKVADEEMRRYGFGFPGGRVEEMRNAISTIPAVHVTVKLLEWKWSTRVQGWRADCELTRDVFIVYKTNEKWSAGSQWFGTTYHTTDDGAKALLDQMRAARIRSALAAQPSPDVVEIDLRVVMMEEIEDAAAQSPWVPPEYTMNEVVSDCCAFLREPRSQSPDVAALVQALREANGILEDALQEVGDDYPGSNCQAWCQQQVKEARAALARVKGGEA